MALQRLRQPLLAQALPFLTSGARGFAAQPEKKEAGLPQMPAFNHTPAPYKGPSKEEVRAIDGSGFQRGAAGNRALLTLQHCMEHVCARVSILSPGGEQHAYGIDLLISSGNGARSCLSCTLRR